MSHQYFEPIFFLSDTAHLELKNWLSSKPSQGCYVCIRTHHFLHACLLYVPTISGSRRGQKRIINMTCVSDVRHIKEAIWIRCRAPNTMNRDKGAHYLSHVYDPLLATPTSGDRWNRRGDQLPSFWWSVLTRTHETVNTSFLFWFWKMNS